MPAWAPPPRETSEGESLGTSKVPSKEEEKAKVIAASPVLPDWLTVAAGEGSSGQVKQNNNKSRR